LSIWLSNPILSLSLSLSLRHTYRPWEILKHWFTFLLSLFRLRSSSQLVDAFMLFWRQSSFCYSFQTSFGFLFVCYFFHILFKLQSVLIVVCYFWKLTFFVSKSHYLVLPLCALYCSWISASIYDQNS
jgi:hypothetical protein